MTVQAAVQGLPRMGLVAVLTLKVNPKALLHAHA